MLDLEIYGKSERQPSDSRKSVHDISNIGELIKQVPKSALWIRTDPIQGDYEQQVALAAELGCSTFMLPMWRSEQDLEIYERTISRYVKKGNTQIVPLVETIDSLEICARTALNRYNYIHFGLNDLSIEMECGFMFNVLQDNRFLNAIYQRQGLQFGFGGVGLVSEEYAMSAQSVLSYHKLFGSTGVILSRDFNRKFDTDPILFNHEFQKLRDLQIATL